MKMEKNKLIVGALISAAVVFLVAFGMGIFDSSDGPTGNLAGGYGGWGRQPPGERGNMTWEISANLSEEIVQLLQELREARAAGDTERMQEIQGQLKEKGFERNFPPGNVSRNGRDVSQ